MSSGWTIAIQPLPLVSSRVSAVKSNQNWLAKSIEPSGRAVQTMPGMKSARERYCASLAQRFLRLTALDLLPALHLLAHFRGRCVALVGVLGNRLEANRFKAFGHLEP